MNEPECQGDARRGTVMWDCGVTGMLDAMRKLLEATDAPP